MSDALPQYRPDKPVFSYHFLIPNIISIKLAAFACFLTFFFFAGVNGKIIRVGAYQNPPKIFISPEGNVEGFFPDLVRAIAAEEGWEVDWVRAEWPDLLSMIERGEIDLLVDVARNPERAKLMAFSDQVALSNWTTFYSRKGEPAVVSFGDLEGVRLGVLRGSVQVPELERQARNDGVQFELVPFSNYRELFLYLQEGLIDVGTVNYTAGRWYARKFPGVRENSIVFQPVGLHFAASRDAASKLLPVIDMNLARMKADPGSAHHQAIVRWLSPPNNTLTLFWVRVGPWLLGGVLIALSLIWIFRQLLRQRTAELSAHVEELEIARKQAEAANRAKTEFLAVMNHELRTPLNSIIGPTELLLEATSDPEKRELLDMVHHSGKHLHGLIRNILELSSIEAGRVPVVKEWFAPKSLVDRIVRSHRVQAERKGLFLDCDDAAFADICVESDPKLITQVLLNLLQNALKFSASGGVTIRCSLKSDAEDDKPQSLAIEVVDTGPGVPLAYREKIFERFQQADMSTCRQHEGTGLGLTISRDIAALLGGTLELSESSPSGSIFCLSIPARVERSKEPAQTYEIPSLQDFGNDSATGFSILIVEDDPDNAKVLEAYLDKLGHKHELATSGEKALVAMKRRSFDIVLMDVRLPGMSGIEVTQHIRSHPELDQPIIMGLTADAIDSQRDACLGAGMNAFLTKPLTIGGLNQALRASLPGVR
ncbi:hypothetical protein DDZ13_08575 [Coraliomargarita sinensis]|uniref:histidine kinase n=1 Tax=Coraliomargarita sinensis TaxID=2174842 RepID=A0A317ZIN8_9BACT|nr:transporter substrate-binding domain-containing protein [Coraliomargarita sinensis]PXA04083.1 hypothetical protein DDZ13_08575 [Coraliomargarita sinensis]